MLLAKLNTKKKAFSLIEVTISLIVVGILLAALSPVISKKIQGTSVIAGAGANSNGRTFTYDPSDPHCKPAEDGENSIDCSFEVPAGVDMINVAMLSGGGGGAGATSAEHLDNQILQTTTANSKTSVTITSALQNVKIAELKGGGGGGGGGNLYAKTNIQNNLLVTKSPFTIPEGMKNVRVTIHSSGGCGGKSAIATGSSFTGYYGGGGGGGATLTTTIPDGYIIKDGCIRFANGNGCVSSSSGYTSRGAYLYVYKDGACDNENYGIFVASGTPGKNASKTAPGAGGAGANLCQYRAGGSAQFITIPCTKSGSMGTSGSSKSCSITQCAVCGSLGGAAGTGSTSINKGGTGEALTNCTHSKSGKTYYCEATPANNTAGFGGITINYDININHQAPVSGGGGGSGAAITNLAIPQNILSSNINGTIEIYSGAGGNAGAARANGTAGKESYVVVKNSAGNIVWGYKALGGAGGGAASTTTGGFGGTGGTCQFYNGNSWVTAACTTNGATGGNGAFSTDGNAVMGGASVGSGYGKSGTGAQSATASAEAGSSGIAKITYSLYFQAAGGGGGGGGAYVQVKGIKVVPQKTYVVRIGAGGKGGNVGVSGQNGGMSRFDFEGVKYSASGAKGGKVGTSQNENTDVIQGTGGDSGKITPTDTSIVFKNGTAGSNATGSGANSIGGNGGASGVNTEGACAGLFINPTICQNNSINASTLVFQLPRNILNTPSFGFAGAGGGGGGWASSNHSASGKGSCGLDGFVYIKWQIYK